MLVSQDELRARFTAGDYVARALRDGYPCCLRSERPCSIPTEPPNTKSLILGFLKPNGPLVFLVHCYLRPDGSLGASGRLDPKYLIADDGSHYYVP
jgi:hypothetical protein